MTAKSRFDAIIDMETMGMSRRSSGINLPTKSRQLSMDVQTIVLIDFDVEMRVLSLASADAIHRDPYDAKTMEKTGLGRFTKRHLARD